LGCLLRLRTLGYRGAWTFRGAGHRAGEVEGMMHGNRRKFLVAASMLPLAAIAGRAHARDLIGEWISAPERGNWREDFDALASVSQVTSNLPIFSPETVSYVEQ